MAARQLHLFKGKRQRGTQAPPPKEFLIHITIANYLRDWCMPNWIWTHFPAGEDRGHVIDKRGKRWSPTADRLKRMGLRPGFPDFQFFSMERHCAFLEMKRRGKGRLSEDQEHILDFLEAAGHPVCVTDSVDIAVKFLKDFGILRSGIHLQ